jgi:dTDP-glucose 4,6-dehydratase
MVLKKKSKATHSCLISGASGFIGSNILAYMLENTDWDFTCIASWRHKGSPLRITSTPAYQANKDRVTIVTHDLAGEIPDIGDFDYILHLASESHVSRSIDDPVPFIENNIASTLRMLEYARKHRPEIFLHFSTDEVYGATEHGEWDVLLPSNPYAASKAAQEMIAISYWKTYKVPVVITNVNNIVGKNQDPEKFVPMIVELIKNNQEVTIHAHNGMPGRRYWNPVENVAHALLFILSRKPQAYANDTLLNRYVDRPDRYNIPGGEELDNLEMATLIASILGQELHYKLVDAEAVRPGYDTFYAKTDGVLKDLGWKPPLTLEQGLAWLKEQQ